MARVTMKKSLSVCLSVLVACSMVLCMQLPSMSYAYGEADEGVAAAAESSHAYDIDMAAWSYDSSNDVYYQIGIVYCDDAQASDYESLAIYVPGAYFTGTSNGDGTYTCVVNDEGAVGDYTAATAPVVMPVNTSGYSAQTAQTSYSYSGASEYLEAGLIYVYAGCRGRNNGTDFDGGAPWGVTDLKAAVRCLRYNADELPGDLDLVFAFGHSGGGAQSAVLGATGDSELYTAYLEEIGAAMYDADGDTISDAIAGAMCWCPITSLDIADEAYEWMMGQYATTGTRADDTWTSAFSDDLAEAFAAYVNQAGLVDEDGTALLLEETDEGIYTSGTYYDYLLGVIETSLNNFLEDTTFPYSGSFTSDSGPSGDMSGGPSGDSSGGPSGMTTMATSYETAADYIDSLNSDETWVVYDEDTNTATITSVEAFVSHCKSASKDVGAFDDLNLGQAENYVFGNGEDDALHFDAIMAELLSSEADVYGAYSDYDASYASDYADDMGNVDALGVATEVRQDMYNPMYYLLDTEEGTGTSTVAKYWRIRTGITQGDTSLTTEVNLALALQANDDVESVDFATVWEQGHEEAERTGDASTNFIAWIAECLEVESTDDDTSGDDTGADDDNADDDNADDDNADDNTDDESTDGDAGDNDVDLGGSDDSDDSDDADDADSDSEDATSSYSFPDVQDPSKWYYESVYAVAELGYMTGYDDGYFGVGDSLTRAQLAVVLWRIACPEEAAAYDADGYMSTTTAVSGIADGKYYTAAADWAVAEGVVNGKEASDGSRYFAASDPVTFQQLCAVMANYLDAEGRDALSDSEVSSALSSFADASSVSSWAAASVAWAVSNGVVNGKEASDGTRYLDPGESVARERVATVLANAVSAGLL